MTLSPEELQTCAEAALALARDALDIVASATGGPASVWTKSHGADWASSTDVEIERHVRAELAARFPDHGVVGEELGAAPARRAGAAVWYCDPIDGTTNYVHGLPWCSFSLAVADEDGLAAGVVADLARGEVLSATRGLGARTGSGPATCSGEEGLLGGIVCTELVGTEVWGGLVALGQALARRGCVTRIMGSSALSIASVGAGRAQAAVLGSAHAIDVAAAVLFAREAGATILAAADLEQVLLAGAEIAPIVPGGAALVAVAPGARNAVLEALGCEESPA